MFGFAKPPEPPLGSRHGTLTVVPDAPKPRITLLSYNPQGTSERRIPDPEELARLPDDNEVNWIDIQGFGDPATLNKVAEIFDLNILALEDLITPPQRPKAEWLAERVLIVLRVPYVDPSGELDVEQVGLVLGPNYVVSFQERYSTRFQPVWDRVMQGLGVIRRRGADYLCWALLDAAIDTFYPALEALGDRLEELEAEAMEDPTEATLLRTNDVRNSLVSMRRVVWPQREAIQTLVRNDAEIFKDETVAYLRDAYEHCLQVSEIIESYRDLVGAVNNTYLSAVSNRTNEVMRVLTIMASLFIPLTFVAGIYGMNFDYMPELKMRYGYATVWVVMLSSAAAMLVYFARRGWIGGGSRKG